MAGRCRASAPWVELCRPCRTGGRHSSTHRCPCGAELCRHAGFPSDRCSDARSCEAVVGFDDDSARALGEQVGGGRADPLCGAWSVERGAWSVERGAWSVERGAIDDVGPDAHGLLDERRAGAACSDHAGSNAKARASRLDACACQERAAVCFLADATLVDRCRARSGAPDDRIAKAASGRPMCDMLSAEMTDRAPAGYDGWLGQEPLALTVGCEFGLNSVQPASAIVQVAPRVQPGVSIGSERWVTN